jgi:hypothetical protein
VLLQSDPKAERPSTMEVAGRAEVSRGTHSATASWCTVPAWLHQEHLGPKWSTRPPGPNAAEMQAAGGSACRGLVLPARLDRCRKPASPAAGAGLANRSLGQRRLDPGSFPCSSPLQTKLSPPFSGPQKSPTAAGIRASGLGVRERNDTANLSPNANLSPKLGAWPFYSTSFFSSVFSSLASL